MAADDVERERRRTQFGEHYRTLLGHFRHEIGHYFWSPYQHVPEIMPDLVAEVPEQCAVMLAELRAPALACCGCACHSPRGARTRPASPSTSWSIRRNPT
jgi:hypothetical protein